MKKENIDYSIYVVTDSLLSRGRPPEFIAQKAIEGGATIIQYREKRGLSTRSMIQEANSIHLLTKKAEIPLIINDRLDIALAIDSEGIHLGQDDLPVQIARSTLGPDKIIGVSVRTEEEARAAVSGGADYLAVSGVFPSTTKLDVGTPVGLDTLRSICNWSPVPVVGIGGIHVANAGTVFRSGAAGVAVISSVVAARDPAAAVRSLKLATQLARTSR